MGNFDFSKYCTPAQLYLVLGAIGIIMGFFKNYGVETLLTNALFLVIWTWVLNWMCSKGFKAISWILVLLPFITGIFTYFFVRDVVIKEGNTGIAGLVASVNTIGGNAGRNPMSARDTCMKGCVGKKDTKGCQGRCPK